MKKLIKLLASACLAAALAACSSSMPSMSDLDSAHYGPRPNAGQIRDGVHDLGGDLAKFDSANGGAGPRLTQGWATDLDNPGSFIYGWQVEFQQDAANGGGTVTALFRDGTVIAATRETAGQTKAERIK